MNPWIVPAIIGGLGILLLIVNYGALIVSVKNNVHISGIPFIGGIMILAAGLLSPIKWLAILCVLDSSFWLFIYAMITEYIFKRKDDPDH